MSEISLGRSYIVQSMVEKESHFNEASEFLSRAVDATRTSGQLDYLTRALLLRAVMHRLNGDYIHAQSDLDEVLRLATRGSMRLYLADCHLEAARLALATGDRDAARTAWATAKAMIEEMGYHRRDKELAEIAQQL